MAIFKGANHTGKTEKNICPIESPWFLITMQVSRLKKSLFLTWLSPKPFFLETSILKSGRYYTFFDRRMGN